MRPILWALGKWSLTAVAVVLITGQPLQKSTQLWGIWEEKNAPKETYRNIHVQYYLLFFSWTILLSFSQLLLKGFNGNEENILVFAEHQLHTKPLPGTFIKFNCVQSPPFSSSPQKNGNTSYASSASDKTGPKKYTDKLQFLPPYLQGVKIFFFHFRKSLTHSKTARN